MTAVSPDRIERMKKILLEEFGISSAAELDRAIRNMEPIDIAAVAAPVTCRKEKTA